MKADIFKDISNNEYNHKSIPFWSWNDKLEKEELLRQIDCMDEAQIGGFFMHARGGLQTEYLSEDWFEMVSACIEKAGETGMQAWAYDEDGWPSGFAAGLVPSLGEPYQQKGLEMIAITDTTKLPSNILGCYNISNNTVVVTDTPKIGDIALRVKINPYYIDALNGESIKQFIKFTHEEYYKRFGESFGTGLKGFFTDEPQYANGLIPWSHILPAEFAKRYGYDLIPNLALLYINAKGYEKFRYDYYSLLSGLFIEGFIKQIYDWCQEHRCMLTGHLMAEDSLMSQMACTGGVMPGYEYFHIPGIDWLGRGIGSPVIPKQLGSAAEQLGKRQTITESFALCGWDTSWNELKWIAEWQYVNGVNMMCQHLEGYSLRGFRKRDYPSPVYIQVPWFEEYAYFNNYFNKLGSALSMGKDAAGVLLIHPLKTAYCIYNPNDNAEIIRYNAAFEEATKRLNNLHIEHHYGDETLMEKYGSIRNGKFVVGECTYSAVVLPSMLTLCKKTLELLLEFIQKGGTVYSMGDLPKLIEGKEDPQLDYLLKNITPLTLDTEIISSLATPYRLDIQSDGRQCDSVHYRMRLLEDGRRLYFVVNLAQEEYNATLTLDGLYDIEIVGLVDEKLCPVTTEHKNEKTTFALSFSPMQSYLILVDAHKEKGIIQERWIESISLKETFEIQEQTPNTFTLDKCEYQIDDGEWKPERAVILIQRELLELKRPAKVGLKYHFTVDNVEDIGELHFIMERPEEFSIYINGTEIKYKDEGYFLDKSFSKIDIRSHVKTGENEIILTRDFYQRQKVYDVIFGENVHEVERNKLTYDTELESCYLIGDFSITNHSDYTYGERKAIFTGEKFSISPPKKTINIGRITEEGYWFFAGSMKLRQTISIEKKQENTRYVIGFEKMNAPVAKLFVNGQEVGIYAFTPYSLDVTDFIHDGYNEIVLSLYSGNRNLLGPHHFAGGESYSVGPDTFTDRHGWADDKSINPMWNDGYCFVQFGIPNL